MSQAGAMSRARGRSGSDTKSLILGAAATLVEQKGLVTSLEEIAAASGISKAGVLYHFKSKHSLWTALGQELLDSLGAQLEAAIDPADRSPGGFARAYIASALPNDDGVVLGSRELSLLDSLMQEPTLRDFVAEGQWDLTRRLYDDGLPLSVVTLIVAAVDGAALAHETPGLGEDQIAALRTQLLELTRRPHLWEALEGRRSRLSGRQGSARVNGGEEES